ncbi:CsbD family protein [Streptomyces sp. NBC_01728]|uniref:CsbD family protein n=1 Tax=unclassified Streptomyces TaxID=2593676 RepID=UPI00224E91FB|nr:MULTISPECIES: CsbD family protein [unclassified Streptomyces]MCX4457975.1 CsbD family protein [Streptomyces sp. NBC_01719]MCX4497332.1 CsbD family protein [Streptomyces sp. NBC_01728]
MSVRQTIKHKTQAFKGRVTERIGRTTRNRRLQREGRTDQISGNLKQSGDKAKDAFRGTGVGVLKVSAAAVAALSRMSRTRPLNCCAAHRRHQRTAGGTAAQPRRGAVRGRLHPRGQGADARPAYRSTVPPGFAAAEAGAGAVFAFFPRRSVRSAPES